MQDEIIERLEKELKEIKNKISELRKIGICTKIVELKIINIPSKISLAKVTKNGKDIETVIILLDNLKKEISDLELEKSILKKDIIKEAEEVYKKERSSKSSLENQ